MTHELQYDKQKLLNQLISQVKQGIKRVTHGRDKAADEAINAPGAMQSHHDMTKMEQSAVADGLDKNVRQDKEGLALLTNQEFKTQLQKPSLKIIPGCVVRLYHERTKEKTDYFIAPYGGGKEMKTPRGYICVMTPASPIGKELIGRVTGDIIQIEIDGKQQDYAIFDFQ